MLAWKPAFELSFEIHFVINMPNVARLLPPDRQTFLFKKYKASFAFCDIMLGTGNIYFHNNMQWKIKMWI